ncbi:MAG: hypothetical protein H6718_13800 [Polyangiaceae bacterium]|nr:hypothetical protein [Myxococcales bacterium]MCB9586471.1 hypothetical protein [Polyangiaceae bacterium]MCB9605978.1 hypothetical protein [Polyangiaceae bacterium]
MKLRTSHLLVIALVGGGIGAWYGVGSARRGDAALTRMIREAKTRAAQGYFCHAPPEQALPQVAARVGELDAERTLGSEPAQGQYPRVELAMLNERLGHTEPANAQWALVLKGCEGEACKREHWRERVQRACKP